jgi:predicted MFS family arabinose efflux permease
VAGGIVMELAGWRSVFLVLGSGYALVTALLVYELRSPRVRRPDASRRARPGRLLTQYFGILRERHPRHVLIAVFLEGFLVNGGLTYLGAFLRIDYALSYSTIGLLLAGFGVGGLLFTVVSRPVIRRLGENGMVRAGGIFVLAGFGLLAFLPEWQLAAIATFLLGFGFFLFHNTLQTNATQMAPDARGSAVSLFAFSLFMGQGAGVALLGLFVDRVGYFLVFLFCGIGMLLLGLWFARMILHKPNA